jgi:hypothetical protein
MNDLEIFEATTQRHYAEKVRLDADLKKSNRNTTKRWMIVSVLALLFTTHVTNVVAQNSMNAQPQPIK